VADSGNYRIQKFSSNGTFITSWGSSGAGNGQFGSPLYLAVDHSGNVYVADNGNNRIQKFSSNGTFITSWGGSGSGNGLFRGPGGIAVDSAGNVYVSDYDNNRVQKFDNTGKFIAAWGLSAPAFGSGNAQFFGPVGVALDSSGNVYVTDTVNNRIQVFSPTR
jgi:tripartite motif-containing protein 71